MNANQTSKTMTTVAAPQEPFTDIEELTPSSDTRGPIRLGVQLNPKPFQAAANGRADFGIVFSDAAIGGRLTNSFGAETGFGRPRR